MEPLHPGDPRQIGPYTLESRLGEGGMGQVFLAVSPGGRRVAVKVIRAEHAEDERFRRRFAREVEAARRVGGFHTAQVVDADPGAPSPWLVTAFVPGPSLQQVVTGSGPLEAGAVRELAAGLAEGLAAIHACGLVHRDLKPGNVIMAADGPRIIDFGVAAATDATALTSHNVVVGTYAYMSPEQVLGDAVGPASDVFSLGCVLTYAATGHGPFDASTIPAIVHRVLNEQPDLSAFPDDLRGLVGGCLAKDPALRPTPDVLVNAPQSVVAPVAAGVSFRKQAPPSGDDEIGTRPNATLLATRRQEAETAPPASPAPVAPQVRRRALLVSGGIVAAAAAVGVPAAIVLTREEKKGAAPAPPPSPKGLISPLGALAAEGNGSFSEVAVSRDGRMVAAGGLDGKITLWDLAGRRPLRTIDRAGWVSALAFSPDGRFLASSASNAGQLLVWETATGELAVNVRTGGDFGLNALAYSPDGRTIVGVNPDAHLFDAATGAKRKSFELGNSGVTSVAYSPDGRTVAVGVDGFHKRDRNVGNSVQLLDGRTFRRDGVFVGHTENVNGVAFSPDGRRVASCGGADRTVRIWDPATRRTALVIRTGSAASRDVRFSPDGRSVLVGCSDRAVRVWNAATGALTATLVGHAQAVDKIALTPDGTVLAGVGGSDVDSVTLWKVP